MSATWKDGEEARLQRLEHTAERTETPCGDGRLVWRAWGEGMPLVLLHGGFGSWRHWIRNIDALAARRRVLAVDLPGLGDSDTAPQPHTPAHLADIILDGLNRLIPRSATFAVAGFSLGAVIGATLAARASSRVAGTFLIGPSGLGPHWRDATSDLRRWTPEMTEAEVHEVVRHNLERTMIASRAAGTEFTVSMQLRHLRRGRGLKGLPLSRSSAVLDALPAIAERTSIIYGANDPYAVPDPAGALDMLRRHFPSVTGHVIDDAGHWVNYEAPEAVNALLTDRIG